GYDVGGWRLRARLQRLGARHDQRIEEYAAWVRRVVGQDLLAWKCLCDDAIREVIVGRDADDVGGAERLIAMARDGGVDVHGMRSAGSRRDTFALQVEVEPAVD